MMGDFIMVRARVDDELHVKKKQHLFAFIKMYKVCTSGEINSSDKEALQVSDYLYNHWNTTLCFNNYTNTQACFAKWQI